jgi:hypothetical protein
MVDNIHASLTSIDVQITRAKMFGSGRFPENRHQQRLKKPKGQESRFKEQVACSGGQDPIDLRGYHAGHGWNFDTRHM